MIDLREVVYRTMLEGIVSGNLSRICISDTVGNVIGNIPYRNAHLGGRGLKRLITRVQLELDWYRNAHLGGRGLKLDDELGGIDCPEIATPT